MTRKQDEAEALSELAGVIEDLFYVAGRLRSAGDSAGAHRLATIAGDVAKERASIELRIRTRRSFS